MTPPVNGIGGATPPGYTPAPRPARRPAAESPFAQELQKSNGLQFSKHAAERVQRRGIGTDPQSMQRLEKGVALAASKGSRNAVVLVDNAAFVVGVPNRTVITAVDRAHMRDQVFTNIDSAVIA